MPRGVLFAGYQVQYGNGAPGANTPQDKPYYDKSTTPYTSYIWDWTIGAWKTFAQGGVNATQLQGTAVTNSAPATGHNLTLTAGAWV